MSIIRMRIQVAEDHTVSGVVPAELPAGEHEMIVEAATRDHRAKPFRFEGFRVADAAWDDSVSLRRENLYATTGDNRCFVDTNVLVYANLQRSMGPR